ncbi:MAG: ABC transporter ATP-binding protein [Gemmatimonadota bacterium]
MILEARDLVVRYRRGLPPALDGVSLHVPAGAFYAVLGPNGSGKSTLMRALLGSIPIESGTVVLDGAPLGAWGRRALARAVGAVTQTESVAFPLTVRALVGMGRYPYLGPFRSEGPSDTAAIERALSRCDAIELADRDVGTLSGGEFQRVRVARALAQEPRALVLDEPTASLDVRHEMEILRLLRASTESGMTVVLITHHLEAAARFADRLLLMDRGRVAAEGTVAEVLQEEVLERVYHWPLAVRTDPLTDRLRITPR